MPIPGFDFQLLKFNLFSLGFPGFYRASRSLLYEDANLIAACGAAAQRQRQPKLKTIQLHNCNHQSVKSIKSSPIHQLFYLFIMATPSSRLSRDLDAAREAFGQVIDACSCFNIAYSIPFAG
jgi:hypothetical protein